MAKYIKNSSGSLVEESSVGTSGGAGDSTKIPHLDANGKLDTSFMPTGIGADTASITASEALAAGDFVNIWNSAGTFKVRKADASTSGKEAHGFVVAAVASAAAATVYLEGNNGQATGLTAGNVYLSAVTAGASTAAAPSATGQVVQRLGVATSATNINFEPSQPITLA